MNDDLNWLTELVSKLPPVEPAPVTLFDTLGVSTRETVISNVLAYYLQENEAHGLGRLFLDGLICCMGRKVEQFPSPYTVEREVDFIDIVIRGESNQWAILVENKIYHILNNDLATYWKRVQATHKAGVVVALKPLVTGNENFVCVTHKDWLQKVRNKREPDDERQRLLFNDFIMTMDNNTKSVVNNTASNETIRLLHQRKDDIARLNKAQRDVQRYIQEHIRATFGRYGFSEKQKRFYYADEQLSESKPVPQLRFYVLDEILTEDKLSIYFELHGDATEIGPAIWDSLNQFYELSGVLFDDNNTDPGVYYHLARIIEEEVMTADDFPAKLGEIIGRFFTPDNSLVAHCTTFWRNNQPTKNESV